MPSKKKKYNARFPAGRIKKIMQTDEEVGKVAQAVPVIISRTLELFVESLLTKTLRITNARNAKTLSPSHMKQCIISESRFDFLRDLVKNIPDIGVNEEQLSGSETGYEATTTGAVAATPSSSSTSPSNGGSDSVTLAAQPSAGTSSLQRSESYTPASSSSSCGAVNYAGTLPVKAPIQPPTQQQQGNHLKRAMNHVGFYKEISLDESGSSSSSSSNNSSSASREPPPPKLTRLHSAPAGGANIVVAATSTTTKASPSIPFKIDILPTLPAATSGSQPRGAPATAPASSSNYKITYKFEPLKEGVSQNPKVTSAVNQHQQQQHQPVFKLDYSNVKLPMTATNSSAAAAATTRHHHPLQPTIKIDLSGISNYGTSSSNPSPSVASSPSGVAVKSSVPATPSTPLSAASSSSGISSNSSSGSGSRNPYIFSTGSAAAAGSSSSSSSSSVAAPVYSSVSSSIPGMDEDYDDI